MTTNKDRVDRLLDDIDELVDWQMSGGDRSQSFHGEQMPRCRWCGEEWHELPITKVMREMRHGSYGFDEFGVPLIDPDYRYDTDTSDWVCPGSGFHGPETANKSWRLPRGAADYQFSDRNHSNPSVRGWVSDPPPRPSQSPSDPDAACWRFSGDFTGWDVQINTEWLTVDRGLPSRREPVGVRHRAVMAYGGTVPVPSVARITGLSHPFWRFVDQATFNANGEPVARMKRFQFEFSCVRLVWDTEQARYSHEDPKHAEFISTAQIFDLAPWAAEWFLKRELTAEERIRGFDETNIVIIDETHEMSEEDLFDENATTPSSGAATTQASGQSQR